MNDENITISESGLLTIGANASKQKITVRATATNGVYASKTIDVDAVDTSTDTYDTLTLSAESEEPGEVVILKVEDSDDDSDEETESYVSVEDEETLTKVFEIFKDKFKNEFDFVD